MVVLEPPFVAPQPFFDPLGGRIEGRLRILGFSGGVQHNACVEMDLAIGLKPGTRFFHDDLTGKAAIKIFPNRSGHMVFNAGPEGLADFHMLSRHSHAHGSTLLIMTWGFSLSHALRSSKHQTVDNCPGSSNFSLDKTRPP
jgi:hypothetical protein